MELDKIILEKVNEEICKALGVSASLLETNTSSTYSTVVFTKKQLEVAIEKCRPKHAILINDYIPDNEIFEMENLSPDKYYCKKLLMMNKDYYENKIENILNNYGINIKVYE
jgi:hypothetical protein